MTGFQPVQSLFPSQGGTTSGILGGTGAGSDGAADLFTQLLSGMVDATATESQATGQTGAFLNAGQGTSGANGGTASPFTPSTIPFAAGSSSVGKTLGAAGTSGTWKNGATTGTAVAALMTGVATNTPSSLLPAASWTQTHWSADTAPTDATDANASETAGTSTQDGTVADTTLAALAAMGAQQQPTPPVPTVSQDATAQAATAQAGAGQTAAGPAPSGQIAGAQAGATQSLGNTVPGAGSSSLSLAGMTPVNEQTAADAALAAQAVQAMQAGKGDGTTAGAPPDAPAKGSAAAAAAASLAVADQKAAALATGATTASPRTPAPGAQVTTSTTKTTVPAAQADAATAQSGTAADAATLAASATVAADGAAKAAKTDGSSGSGLKTGTPKTSAKGDTAKLSATPVSVTTAAGQDKAQVAATADQTRQQTADSATDDSGSNGLMAAPAASGGMTYADAHAAAASPLAKVGDTTSTATPAAMTLANATANSAPGTPASTQAALQVLLQQQVGNGRTTTASNGLLATTENGLLPASGTESVSSTSTSDAALNASGFMGLVDGQHTFPTGFAATQMASTSQARQAQYPPVLQQVSMGFQKAANNGMDSVTIQLTPDDMGSIDVKLDFHKDGKVRASVTADNAKTLDLLQRNSDDLQKALQDAGLQTDNDSLSFNLKDDGQAPQQQERRSGQSGAQFSMDDTTAAEEAASPDTIIPSLGRVDVRI